MRLVVLAAAVVASASAVFAQPGARGKTVGADPFTRGSAERIAKAGYNRVGEMPWAPGHDTAHIEKLLGQLPFCWIETKHFRIGSTLPPLTLRANKKVRVKVQAELKRLKRKLPAVNPKAREIGRWLRAHLFAMRLEDLYEDFSKRLGVTDASFPTTAPPPGSVGPHMGVGPYLGAGGKYLVMLFEHEAGFARYTQKHCGQRCTFPRRHSFGQDTSLWFGTSLAFHDELWNDTALHCHVTLNVVSNLVDGYKQYLHDVPAWFRYGVACWYCRRIDHEFNNFERADKVEPDIRDDWHWRPRVWRLVKNGGATKLAELTQRMDCESFKFRDYMMSWSLVDYLMTRGDDKFATFTALMKDPIGDRMVGGVPEPAAVIKRQGDAMESAWKAGIGDLELAWGKWVLKSYRNKKY